MYRGVPEQCAKNPIFWKKTDFSAEIAGISRFWRETEIRTFRQGITVKHEAEPQTKPEVPRHAVPEPLYINVSTV